MTLGKQMFPNPCLDQYSWQDGFFPLQDEGTPNNFKVEEGATVLSLIMHSWGI